MVKVWLLMGTCAVRVLCLAFITETGPLLEVVVINYIEVRLCVIIHVMGLGECGETALTAISCFDGVSEFGYERRDSVEGDMILISLLMIAIDFG